MNRIKRFSQAVLGAIGGAFAGFLLYAFTGLISGMQWGVSIGLFIGLISVLTGGGISGFLNALISSILAAGLIGTVLSGLFGVVGGGFIGSSWGFQENATSDEPEVTRYESDRATLVERMKWSLEGISTAHLCLQVLCCHFKCRHAITVRR